MNVVCIIAYDGSRFCGFINGNEDKTDPISESMPSVKGYFQAALRRIGIESEIIASGRTDRYVHATGQVINFHTSLNLSQMPLQKMRNLLNAKLYPHVFIRRIYIGSEDFHSRFHARMRFYRYIFRDGDISPFFASYISKLSYGSICKMREALGLFLGSHDFCMFKKSGSDTKDSQRHIYKASLFSAKIHGLDCLVAHIGANGFLRSQIRIMMKACAEFSKDSISKLDLQRQIDNDSSLSSPIRELAPPYGLYLSRVVY